MQVIGFIQAATYELTPDEWRLSPVLWTAFSTLNKIHGLWRWYRRVEIYKKPDNLVHLLAGHALNWIVGETLLLRIAAQCLLVATRLWECAEQQAALYRAGHRWMLAFKGEYPKIIHMEWLVECAYASPSSIYWWRFQIKNLAERVYRVFFCTISVCKQAFKLSMCIMDVMDALNWSPSVQQEAFGEGFVNISKWITLIVEQKEELLQGLEDNQMIIEKLLKGSPIAYSQLHQAVETTAEKVESAHRGVKKLSEFVGETGIYIGKKMLAGGMGVIGLGRYMPATLAEAMVK